MKTKKVNRTKQRVLAVVVALLALLGLMLLDFVPALRVQAATSGAGIGFYVQALLPENQRDKNLTYFDLRVQPGQSQTLEVQVVNETNEAITVDVAAISASTNRNGVIDYKTPGIQDKSLLHPFSGLARWEEESLSIPARSSVTARVTVQLPADEYDGVVLGGLVFTRRPEGAAQSGAGTTLQNIYSYVIGVQLSETDTPVQPDFELDGVQGEVVNYEAALVHGIRNKAAAIAKGVSLHVVVRNAAGAVVAEETRTNVDMAPNSLMPLALAPLGGTGEDGQQNAGPGALAPGDYTSEVNLTHGGQSWQYQQSFTITGNRANEINAGTVGSATQSQLPLNTLLFVLLGAAVLVIVILFIILMRMLRRRQETKELNRLRRQRQEQLRLRREYAKKES
ncbi:DUF916 and DUF3324 domain-containing protein [Ruminococcaceae bacterium OttesenSCG-928-O06]|nr:DUF916 and DUF3324 domain-containing protein [Ruminococcaceae bacterium OttesenSCG-928-O06]